jgi:hypothetical protein
MASNRLDLPEPLGPMRTLRLLSGKRLISGPKDRKLPKAMEWRSREPAARGGVEGGSEVGTEVEGGGVMKSPPGVVPFEEIWIITTNNSTPRAC